jgi:diguanylate cyclase (GGDEF)-like protein
MNERVLVVDDEAPMVELLEYVLGRAGYDVTSAGGGLEALDKIERCLPHLVVADVTMPDLGGLELARRVRQRPGFELLPFVFLTARSGAAELIDGVDLAADDYLAKPFERAELLARIEAALRRAVVYQRAARTDSLTELGNREQFEHRLREELYRQQRYGVSSSLALVAIDVGSVDTVAASLGSAAADQILRFVGRFLRTNVRALDVPTRFSETGFIVLMPHTSRDRAVIAIERLSERLNAQCPEIDGQAVPVNASFGVAIVDRDIADLTEMLQHAQASMMAARRQGQGVVVWTETITAADEESDG